MVAHVRKIHSIFWARHQEVKTRICDDSGKVGERERVSGRQFDMKAWMKIEIRNDWQYMRYTAEDRHNQCQVTWIS